MFFLKIFFIILFSIIIINKLIKFEIEHFIDKSSIIFKTIFVKNNVITLSVENNIYDSQYIDLINNKLDFKLVDEIDNADILLTNTFKLYDDTLINSFVDTMVITITNNPNVCIFFMNSNSPIIKNLNNLSNQGKTYYLSSKMVLPELSNLKGNIKIGYCNDYELKLIRNIFYSCNLDKKNIELEFIKVNYNNIVNNLFIDNNIDIFFYFNTEEHPLLKDIYKEKYTVLNFSNLETNKIKALIPFANIDNINIGNVSANTKTQKELTIGSIIGISGVYYTTIKLDNVIYTKNLKINDVYYTDIINFYDSYKTRLLNSYYSEYFNYNLQKKFQENFTDSKDTLEITYKVNNVNDIIDIPNDDKNNEFQLYYKISVHSNKNYFLKKNDIINIINNSASSNQSLVNDKYYVKEVLNNNEIIISKYKIIYLITNTDVIELSKDTDNIDYIIPENKLLLKDNDIIFVSVINKEGIIIDNKIKIISSKNSNNDKYTCYENPSINNKYLCEGIVNVDGTKKPAYTWDKMCMKNSDCDFYDPKQTKSNFGETVVNGKCVNGYCDLPIGINRKSYKKYELSDVSYPLCKDCGFRDNLENCCNDKTNYLFDYKI